MSKPKSSWEYINFYDSEETLNASYYADLVDHLVEQMTTPKPIEPEKKFAEKLNGRLAMIGIIAGIGAYLTTGQLIPGFV